MANKVYDSEADKQAAPITDNSLSGNQTSPGNVSYNRGGLDRNSLRDKENKGLYNPHDNQTGTPGSGNSTYPTKSAGPDALKSAEESNSDEEGNDSLYSAGGDEQSGLRGRAKGKAKSLKSRVLKKKLLVGVLAGGGGALIALIIIISIIAGAYKAVAFAEHVAAYQFARSTAQMAEDTGAIDSEKFGLDSLLSSASGTRGAQLYNTLQDKYTAVSGSTSDLWSNLDKYRPDKIMQNFNDDGTFKFVTSRTRLGKTYISGVSGSAVGDETINLQSRSLSNAVRNKVIPGYKFVSRDVAISRNIAPDIIEGLKANDIGPITRARFAAAIRSELDISLVAWETGKYLGKSEADADGQVEKDTLNVAEGSEDPTNSAVPSNVNSAAEDAKSATDSAVQDPAKLADIVNSGGQLPTDLINSLNNSFPTSVFSSVESTISEIVGLANPVYKFAVPLCLIYDGSLQNSGPTIDNQDAQLERSAVWVQSAAAQEKDGSAVNAEAVGATDWKLGNITTSNAEARASGEAVDTSDYQSTETSPIGEYSIADYGLGSTLGGIVNSLAGPICPAATNLWVGAGLGTLAIFLTGGSDTATDGAVDVATQSLGDQLSARLLATAGAGRDALSDVFSWSTVRTLGAIGVGTLVAKALVLSQTGAVHNSLATGQSYDNDVDSGTNIYANQIEQQQFYGAPLSDQNLAQDNEQDQAQLAVQNSRQSAYSRYLALSNANSLVSRLVIDASAYTNSSLFSSLLHFGGTLLDPMRTLGSLLSPIISQSSYAATTVTSANTFYGNVQFGFTPYEKSLIQSNSTYLPLPNQQYLDRSGQEANIAARYGKCFDGSETIGQMLANGDIVRKSSGDVDPNHGLCSPINLGTANHDTGCNITANCDYTGCPSNKCGPLGEGFDDLVFRWRVAQGYNNTLEQLTSEQSVTTSSTPSTPTAPTGGGVYQNPFHDQSGLTPSRVDSGVDFASTKPVPIYPIATGTVTQVESGDSSFYPPLPNWITYQITPGDGPAGGKYIYVAEDCPPLVHEGEALTTNTELCAVQPASIETGWALDATSQAAAAYGVYTESNSTAYGQNFSELLDSLGVTVKACYDHPGEPLQGTLPSGWPTWATHPATNAGPNACSA
jgi:hypothetical protein